MTYNELLKSGWHMDEIDHMDMPGFLRIRAWGLRREKEEAAPKKAFIEDIWPMQGRSPMLRKGAKP